MGTATFDEQLIAQIGLGSGEAFRQLYLATSDAVFGYALSILRNKADAEDVMHDAYIKIHKNASSYQPLGKPMAWVLTIVKHLCYNKLSADKPTVDLGDVKLQNDAGQTQQGVLDRLVLKRALETLELQDRQIVILHALTGMKHREIAQLLEMPQGTVMSKYHRSLNKLKETLEREGDVR